MSITRRVFIDVATASRLDLDPETIRRVEQRLEDAISSGRRRTLFIVAVLLTILVGWAIGAGVMLLGAALGVGTGVSIAVVSITNPLVFVTVWLFAFPRAMRRMIRRVLREHGYDVCVRCGYRLEGIAEPARCPECGKTTQTPLGRAAR